MTSSDRSKSRNIRRFWAGVVLAAALAMAVAITWLVKPTVNAATASVPPEIATLEAVQAGLVWVADIVGPSVVFIEAEQKMSAEEPPEQDQGEDDELLDPWRRFFGPGTPFGPPRPPQRMPSVGQGSGVIIDSDGHILTNNHVVGSSSKITVHFEEGESYPARLIATDKLTDFAVIKVEPKRPLTPAKLGDADKVKPGMWALAIGYPFGGTQSGYGSGGGRFDEPQRYEPTLTLGVISATNRQIQSDIPGRPFRDLIQTDAPINPGNSGGPLVNTRAEVIGINQAIFTASPFGGNIGVGFAIPINARTKEIVNTLKGGGTVVRGQLGVQIRPLTPALKNVYKAKNGVFVDSVQPDSPAAIAGIEAEDIITTYQGKAVISSDQFVTMVQGTKPDTVVDIGLLRAGKPMSLEVKIAAYTPEAVAKKPAAPEKTKLGLAVEPLPEEMAREIGVSGGVRIRAVNPLGDGARAGLQPGDVIIRINRENISGIADYERVVEQLKKGDAVVVRTWVNRTKTITTSEIDSLSE